MIFVICGIYLSFFMVISSGLVFFFNFIIIGVYILGGKINIVWKILNLYIKSNNDCIKWKWYWMMK